MKTKTNICYYGLNGTPEALVAAKRIIEAKPDYLVANSQAGPWPAGNADIKMFTDAGIKYFEYLDGGYEGTNKPENIPNDLGSNLAFITAAAKAGATGIFIDQASAVPFNIAYLSQLANRAHGLGLLVVFNVGVEYWDNALMEYCDYVSSSESWRGEALTSSQKKWASKVWLLSKNITNAGLAISLATIASALGIDAQYSCPDEHYSVLPDWFGEYMKVGDTPVVILPVSLTDTQKIEAIKKIIEG